MTCTLILSGLGLCGSGETQRERDRKWKGKGRWGTASLCVSYYRRHMARWIEILTIPYVLVLNGFTYFRFFFVNSYIVNNLRSFIYNVLLNWVAGNRHQQNIFINFIWYRLAYDFIGFIPTSFICFSLGYTDNFIQGYSWMEPLLR